MFKEARAFNGDISNWNVSSVTAMNGMFYGTPFDQDISSWDVSSVIYMGGMFYGTTSFNQDMSSWDISSVTSMGWMLDGAMSFNQDLCAWGDKFPYNTTDGGIFTESGCTFQETPQESQQGPFCASSCN